MRFAVIGGDMRQSYVCAALEKRGYDVVLFGFDKAERVQERYTQAASLREAAAQADAVVLPFPAENDRRNINAPYCHTEIYLSALMEAVPAGCPVFAGKVSGAMADYAKRCAVELIDYAAREELIIRNAVPSAEGAIQIAMEELPITLHNARCLVVGYGRIGKVLSGMLAGIGAQVTVSARKAADLAWLAVHGFQVLHTNALSGSLGGFQAVFNTVPSMVFSRSLLEELPPDCLIIDLASQPGGVDFDAARRLPRKAIHALSLPGKVAPETAGEAVAETVLAIIKERYENPDLKQVSE